MAPPELMLMKIPQSPVDLKAYHQAIIAVLDDAAAPIYVDTSFLMWMLQAGDDVRADLLRWFQKLGTARVVIPTWSAHELYRHIRTEKALKDLQGRLKQYTSTFRQALMEMSVSADDALCVHTPFNDRSHLLQSLRADFVRLNEQLSIVLDHKKIQSQYQRALSDVIDFVNKHVAETDPFTLFTDISTTKDLRFSSRVPPGFKDEGKEGKGENSCGDLVFWQEVLVDLAQKKCGAALILTNDNKSDWHYKPDHVLNYRGDRRSLKPQVGFEARLPHPLLEHEAHCKAKVERLSIIDVNILAVVLDKVDSSAVRRLVAATHPALLEKDEEGINWTDIDPVGSAPASPQPPVADVTIAQTAPAVVPSTIGEAAPSTSVALLRDPGTPSDEFGTALSALTGELADRTSALDMLISGSFLHGRTRDQLVLLGRRTYRSAALQGFPADLRLAELLQAATTLDSDKKNALALGMLVELYFDEQVKLRPTPLDGPWQVLFDLQYQEPFEQAVEQIAEMLAPYKNVLLVVPRPAPDKISVELQLVKPPERGPKQLESLIVGSKELLGDAVPASASSLTALVGDRPSTVGAVLRAVSRRFFVPLRQMEANKDELQPLSWSDEKGLRLLRLDHGGVCDELSLSFPGEDS